MKGSVQFAALLALVLSLSAQARSPMSPARLALLREASLREAGGLRSSPLPRPPTEVVHQDGLGLVLTGIFERQVTLPGLGTIILRPGQTLMNAPDATPNERLVRSGRIWEKILNGFEAWSQVYQNSVQLVKFFD